MRKAVLALVAGGLLAAATAGGASANHAWNDYHWARTSNPFTLTVQNAMSTSWTTYFGVAIADWDRSAVMVLVPTVVSSQRQCRAPLGKVRVCDATYGYNGWLGLATISIDTAHHITKGSAKMNDTYFALSQYNNINEKQHVLCQEVGHDFGLGHQDESGISLNTCMDYYHNTSDTDTKSTHPNQHDYDQLAIIYSHTDSYSTATAAASISNPGLADNENASPVATERSDHITNSVITERYADGSANITHIYWALDGPGRR